MDIAETLKRARLRDLMLDAFAAHERGEVGHSPYWNSDWSQALCVCGTLFTRSGDVKVIEEEVAALMDG